MIGFALASQFGTAQPLYEVAYRPLARPYRVIETPHFDLIFEAGAEAAAREAGAYLESNLPPTRPLVGLRGRLHMPVVLHASNDLGNGRVAPLMFRQEVDIVGIRGKSIDPGYLSWLEAVLPHELTHAAQAEVRPLVGFGGVIGLVWPDLNRFLNFTVPPGITEGLAVYRESELRPNMGRLNYSLFQMHYLAAAAAGRPWSLAEMLEIPHYVVPFNRFYIGGAQVVERLVRERGEGALARTLRVYNRWPFFGYGAAFWIATGRAPFRFGPSMRRQARAEALAHLDAHAPFTEGFRLATAPGTSHRRPRWVDDSTLVVYAEGYALTPGLYTVDATTGRRRLRLAQRIADDGFFTMDRPQGRFLFARYDPHVLSLHHWTADLHALRVGGGKPRRLTSGAHLTSPVPGPDGGVWALRANGPFTDWVYVTDGGEIRRLTNYARSDFRHLAPAPPGHLVAILAVVGARQGVLLARSEGDLPQLDPLLFPKKGAVYDPTWSPDGRYLLFAADPDGVANIYVLDRTTGDIRRLTNVPFGAVEPAVSPNGRRLAYVSYRHERFDLYTMDFDPESGVVVDGVFDRTLDAPLDSLLTRMPYQPVQGDVRPYRSVSRLWRPRALMPVVRYDPPPLEDGAVDLGLGVGLGVAGTDPLLRWAYGVNGLYQKGRLWGEAWLQTGRLFFRPRARAFAEPSTQVVRLVDDEGMDVGTRRVGREEQGVEIEGGFPLYLDVSSDQTTASLGVRGRYRRVRFFDDQGEALSRFSERWTLFPTAGLAYRVRRNHRDIVPTRGMILTAAAEVDVHADAPAPSRALVTRARFYSALPLRSNDALELELGLLTQNRGSIYNPSRFVPRGYEDDLFPSAGTHVKGGATITLPIRYVENGLFLIPLYVHAVYLYGFADVLAQVEDLRERSTSVGGGFGVEFRVAHFVEATLRVGLARRLEQEDWEVTFR